LNDNCVLVAMFKKTEAGIFGNNSCNGSGKWSGTDIWERIALSRAARRHHGVRKARPLLSKGGRLARAMNQEHHEGCKVKATVSAEYPTTQMSIRGSSSHKLRGCNQFRRTLS